MHAMRMCILPGRAASRMPRLSHAYVRKLGYNRMHQARELLMTHSPFYPLGVPDILTGEMPPLAMLPNLPLIAPQAFTTQPATTAALNPQPLLTAPLQLPTVQPPAPALQPLPQPLFAQMPAALPQPAAVAATLNQPQATATVPVPMHQASVSSVAPLVAPAITTPTYLVTAGLYLGPRVMPLPQKLLAKILKLEFVEIHELLPETWLSSIEEEPTKCCSGSTKEKKEEASH